MNIAVTLPVPVELRRPAGRIGIDLHGQRRRREARARERLRGGLRVAHEMADMIEENLAAERQLAIGWHFGVLRHLVPAALLDWHKPLHAG